MTAGLFARHGCWTGKIQGGNLNNPLGNFENKDIKRYLIDNHGRLFGPKLLKDSSFGPFIQSLEPTDPWMVKHGVFYWSIWRDFDPQFILVRRDPQDILDSCKRVGFPKHDRDYVARSINELDYVKEWLNGVDVNTQELIDGDYSSLETAMDICGIAMDEKIVKEFINPSYWHFNSDKSNP